MGDEPADLDATSTTDSSDPVEDAHLSTCQLPHPLLEEDARGDAVLHLQDMLIRAAHDLSQEGGTNGIFSSGLTKEVKAFQAFKGLRDDGKVGIKTWGKLHEVIDQHI